jgi:hypothetical protein
MRDRPSGAIMTSPMNSSRGDIMHAPEWMRQATRRKSLDFKAAAIATGASPLTIRLAGPLDEEPLRRLAGMDSSATPTGEVLVAEVDGRLLAAVSLDDGHLVADPFRPTGELAWLLVERARALSRPPRSRLSGRLAPVAS